MKSRAHIILIKMNVSPQNPIQNTRTILSPERERERGRVCVCVCVLKTERERERVCVCVYERKKERKREKEQSRDLWRADNLKHKM